MLVLDPEVRLTAKDGLSHPYLSEFHEPENEPISPPYDDSFESLELAVSEWKSEINNIHTYILVYLLLWQNSILFFFIFIYIYPRIFKLYLTILFNLTKAFVVYYVPQVLSIWRLWHLTQTTPEWQQHNISSHLKNKQHSEEWQTLFELLIYFLIKHC